jgi:hypothetical protein
MQQIPFRFRKILQYEIFGKSFRLGPIFLICTEGRIVDQVHFERSAAVVWEFLNGVHQFCHKQIKIILRNIRNEKHLLRNVCHRISSRLFSAETVIIDEIYKRLKPRIIISLSAPGLFADIITT